MPFKCNLRVNRERSLKSLRTIFADDENARFRFVLLRLFIYLFHSKLLQFSRLKLIYIIQFVTNSLSAKNEKLI